MLARPLKLANNQFSRCVSSNALAGNKWGVSRPGTLEDIRAALRNRASSSSSEAVTSPQSKGKDKGKGKARLEPVSEEHLKHRQRMKQDFPEGWNPPRKLSRDAMDGLRALHAHDPDTFSTPVLAERFRVSPEAVRRILRSRWIPKAEERAKLVERERKRREEFKERRVQREREKEWEWVERKEREKDGLELQ